MAYSQKGSENKNTIITSLWFKLSQYILGAFMRFIRPGQQIKPCVNLNMNTPIGSFLICKNRMLNYQNGQCYLH